MNRIGNGNEHRGGDLPPTHFSRTSKIDVEFHAPAAWEKKIRARCLVLPALYAIVMIVLSACAAVGPDYHKPAVAAAGQWTAPLAGGETNAAAVAAWWKSFGDPELNSLVDRAVASNLDLRIARSRVREARAQAAIAGADLLPTLDAIGAYQRQRQSKNQPVLGSLPIPSNVPFENNVFQAGFDASWEVDVFGGVRRGIESATASAAAAEYGQRDALVTLLGEVARNYIDARGLQRRLAIAQQNIQAQQEALGITKDRYAHGLTSDLDVQQAATLLATTRAEVPTLESDFAASVRRIDVLLGQPPGAVENELAAVAPIPAAPPRVPVGLPADLLLRRPDVRQAERELAAATAQIGVAQSDLWPKFYLTGSAGWESVSASSLFAGASQMWSVGPTAQWRIFDAGRIRANVRVQNARQEQALARYEQTALTSFEEVEDALTAYAKEQTRRESLAAAVGSSEDSLHLARQLYANGLTSFLNVLDAERSVYQAEDQLAQSDRAVSADLVALYKALGGGWEIETSQASL